MQIISHVVPAEQVINKSYLMCLLVMYDTAAIETLLHTLLSYAEACHNTDSVECHLANSCTHSKVYVIYAEGRDLISSIVYVTDISLASHLSISELGSFKSIRQGSEARFFKTVYLSDERSSSYWMCNM